MIHEIDVKQPKSTFTMTMTLLKTSDDFSNPAPHSLVDATLKSSDRTIQATHDY